MPYLSDINSRNKTAETASVSITTWLKVDNTIQAKALALGLRKLRLSSFGLLGFLQIT